MNGKMWLHPATQQNVDTLKSRGAEFIGPEEGLLSCGYEGIGRLWPVGQVRRPGHGDARGQQAPRASERLPVSGARPDQPQPEARETSEPLPGDSDIACRDGSLGDSRLQLHTRSSAAPTPGPCDG